MLLWVLVAAVLWLRHLSLAFGMAEFPHIDGLVEQLVVIDDGTLELDPPELWQTGIRLSGALYYWLSYPARLLCEDPMAALSRYYALVELLGITG